MKQLLEGWAVPLANQLRGRASGITAGVLVQVKKDQLEEKGQKLSADEEQKMKAPILEKYETEGHPLYATSRLWDDGVIDPRQTRSALALALSASLNAPIPDYQAPVFRM